MPKVRLYFRPLFKFLTQLSGWRRSPLLLFSGLMVAAQLQVTTAAVTPAASAGRIDTTDTDILERVTVMLELESEPAALVYSAVRTATAADSADLAATTRSQIATILSQQQNVSRQLVSVDAEAIYSLQKVYNGIVVHVPEIQLSALERLDGVKAVHALTPKRPSNLRSVPFIGAPILWGSLAGSNITGKGITIAIIDTGVDYLHTDFGGNRDYINNDPLVIGEVAGFPSAKIIGGYDFAGDEYNADRESESYNPIPAPDRDPFDCFGHGTHVAGTAAGYGVTSDHRTYVGDYSAATSDTAFSIAPGVAPEAQIYALKVFGCEGSSDLTELAIEWSVDPNGDGDFSDHVDVINMSLGSPYGSIYDPSVIASRNAAKLGIIVVASAGNDGDTFFGVSAPSVADATISVASSGRHRQGGTTGKFGTIPQLDASHFSSRGPRRHDLLLKPDITAPGEAIVSARSGGPGWDAQTLSGTSMAAPHVAGAMALLRQRYPTWQPHELKALVMNTSRLQYSRSPTVAGPTRAGAGMIDLVHALRSPVVAFGSENPAAVGVSFGAPDVSSTTRALRSIRLSNRSEQEIKYVATYATLLDLPGVAFTLEQSHVTVPSMGQAELSVRMTADAESMRHIPDPSLALSQVEPRHWLTEETGHVILWPTRNVFTATLSTDGATHGDSTEGSFVQAAFHYEPVSGTLHYTISQSLSTTMMITDASIRRGLVNESISEPAYPLITDQTLDPGEHITGTVRLLPGDAQVLAGRALLLEVASPDIPERDRRAQLEPEQAILHLPIYVAPRRVSSMRAAISRH